MRLEWDWANKAVMKSGRVTAVIKRRDSVPHANKAVLEETTSERKHAMKNG